jgi:hypothetical protein
VTDDTKKACEDGMKADLLKDCKHDCSGAMSSVTLGLMGLVSALIM